jgi:hypothetical protein
MDNHSIYTLTKITKQVKYKILMIEETNKSDKLYQSLVQHQIAEKLNNNDKQTLFQLYLYLISLLILLYSQFCVKNMDQQRFN